MAVRKHMRGGGGRRVRSLSTVPVQNLTVSRLVTGENRMDVIPGESTNFTDEGGAKRGFRDALESSPSRPDAKTFRSDEHGDDPAVGSSSEKPGANMLSHDRCVPTSCCARARTCKHNCVGRV